MKKFRSKKSVSVEHEGKEYRGENAIDGEVIDVFFDGREKSTHLGGHEGFPDALAKILLREMVAGMPD